MQTYHKEVPSEVEQFAEAELMSEEATFVRCLPRRHSDAERTFAWTLVQNGAPHTWMS